MLKWSSNNAEVADRAFTICRVVKGQIEIMPDPKTGRFVGVYIDDKPPSQEGLPPDTGNSLNFIVEAR